MFYFDCFTVDTYRCFCWHLLKLTSAHWLNSWLRRSTKCQQKEWFLNKNTNIIHFSLVKSSTSIISTYQAVHAMMRQCFIDKNIIYWTRSWSPLFLVYKYSLHLLHPIAYFHLKDISWATNMLSMLNIFKIFCCLELNSSSMALMQVLSKCGWIVVAYLLQLLLLHVVLFEIFNTAIFS